MSKRKNLTPFQIAFNNARANNQRFFSFRGKLYNSLAKKDNVTDWIGNYHDNFFKNGVDTATKQQRQYLDNGMRSYIFNNPSQKANQDILASTNISPNITSIISDIPTKKNISQTPTPTLDASILPNQSPNLNRSQTRDWLRNNNINPYSLSGDERRGLRYYLNGDTTGQNYDINLVKNLNDKYNFGFKFQQGGQINMNEEQLQQAFLQYLMQKTGAKDQQQLEQVIQQLGEEGLKQAYAEFMQAMQQQQVQAAKFGAKLNYIKRLNGQCPEGTEMYYYKQGGRLCRKCMQAKQKESKQTSNNPIDAFKCGRKIKEKNEEIIKHQQGGPFAEAFNRADKAGDRYFFYNGRSYNTFRGHGQTREEWARTHRDNLTSGGANNVLTDAGLTAGWQNKKGANPGRYNSKGVWTKFRTDAQNQPLALKGDNVTQYRAFGIADRPTDKISTKKGTNRGKQTTNRRTKVTVGNPNSGSKIPWRQPKSNKRDYIFSPWGFASNSGTFVISPITPQV